MNIIPYKCPQKFNQTRYYCDLSLYSVLRAENHKPSTCAQNQDTLAMYALK